MNEQSILNSGVGRKLVFLGHAADMITILLSADSSDQTEYAIHIMAKGAVFYQGKQLTNTEEIDEYNKALTRSLYEVKTAKLLSSKKDFVLQAISYDSKFSLSLVFSHELVIRSLQDSNLNPDDELWRVFFPWRAESSIVCRRSGIELEQPDFSQEELNRIRHLLHQRGRSYQ